MSRFGLFKINGVEYDLDDITLDEMEVIEEHAGGTPFSQMNFGSAKVMKAIAYTLSRRTDPTIEMSDIGQIKLLDFAPPDEEVPDAGPPAQEGSEDDSAPADAGVPLSAGSTRG